MEYHNQFTDRIICIYGTVSTAILSEIKKSNPSEIKNTVSDKAHYIVYGVNPKENINIKIKKYKHHGQCPILLSLDDVKLILKGETDDYYTDKIKKNNISLDSSYYNWTPILISGEDAINELSSPLPFDFNSINNPLSGQEIYVPNNVSGKTELFRQLIGNYGGFANADVVFDYTNRSNNTKIIVLAETTYNTLMANEKDDIILNIEEAYNKSKVKIFNIQFTREKDVINWIENRLKSENDTNNPTLDLLNKYKDSITK